MTYEAEIGAAYHNLESLVESLPSISFAPFNYNYADPNSKCAKRGADYMSAVCEDGVVVLTLNTNNYERDASPHETMRKLGVNSFTNMGEFTRKISAVLADAGFAVKSKPFVRLNGKNDPSHHVITVKIPDTLESVQALKAAERKYMADAIMNRLTSEMDDAQTFTRNLGSHQGALLWKELEEKIAERVGAKELAR